MRNPKRWASAAILVGMIGLFPLTRKARFQAFHTVDVLQLLASGACFGGALTALLMYRRRDSGPDA